MLITLIIWIYAAFLSFSYGYFFWMLTNRIGRVNEEAKVNFPMTLLVGLAFLTTIASYLSLFTRIGLLANLILLGGAILILVLGRKDLLGSIHTYYSVAIHSHILIWILGIFLLGVILIKTVGLSTNWDTGLYHAQAILWIETYPAVPGLANLLNQLGFNSAWLMTSAIFSFSFLGSITFHVMDGFLLLLALGVFLRKVNRLLRGEITASNIAALGLIFLGRRLLTWEVSSPGTDLPATVLLWVLLLLGLEELESSEMDLFRISSLFILVCFTTTIKLSSVPILLLLVILIIWRKIWKQKKYLIFMVSGCATLYLPWLARNIILTGYLVFPFAAIDLFRFDWKVPEKVVVDTADWIRSWARFPQGDKDVILKMTLSEWLPPWFRQQADIDRLILLSAFGGMVLHGIGLLVEFLSRNRSKDFLRTIVITMVAFAGGLFWLLQAPAIRFGYGFLGFLVVFPASLGGAKIVRMIPSRIGSWAIGLFVLVLIAYQVPNLYASRPILAEYLLEPEPYPAPSYSSVQAKGFILQSPDANFQCWDIPLPCAPWYDGSIELRGNDLGDGFRIPDKQ
jgi:hypothetical protein